MSAAPSILITGLPWDHKFVAAFDFDPAMVRDVLDAALLSINNGGVNIMPHWFAPDTDPEAGMDKFVALLESNDYDAVMIGWGVRGQAHLTPHFEQLVNHVREKAPRAKLLFNSDPASTVDAVRRAFPDAEIKSGAYRIVLLQLFIA